MDHYIPRAGLTKARRHVAVTRSNRVIQNKPAASSEKKKLQPSLSFVVLQQKDKGKKKKYSSARGSKNRHGGGPFSFSSSCSSPRERGALLTSMCSKKLHTYKLCAISRGWMRFLPTSRVVFFFFKHTRIRSRYCVIEKKKRRNLCVRKDGFM